jgi:hypothetical protein
MNSVNMGTVVQFCLYIYLRLFNDNFSRVQLKCDGTR